jgi:hypothetical protein
MGLEDVEPDYERLSASFGRAAALVEDKALGHVAGVDPDHGHRPLGAV